VLAATAIWSGNFIVARALTDSVPPVTLAFFRWLVALIVLLPFGIGPMSRNIRVIRKHLVYLSITGFLVVTIFNTLVYIAARTSNTLNLTLIAICSPIFIVMFARLFLGDTLTYRRIVGLVTATFGVLLLITQGNLSRLISLTFSEGDVWMLISAALFGVYSILVRIKPSDLRPVVFLCSTFIIGLIFLVPWVVWELRDVEVIKFSSTVIAAIVYLGIGPSLLAYLCWNKAIMIIGPVRTAVVYYSLPLFSGTEALLLLGEPVHAVHILSGVLILMGVIVATRE
jgi:drug/metabolite transporter (DMT)-like permease